MYSIEQLLNLEHSFAAPLFEGKVYPWEILPELGAFILELGKTLPEGEYLNPSEGVWIAVSAAVAPTAAINAPCIIGARTEVRHGAFIRGGALVGEDAVVGNSVELKNCVLFDRVQVPHYNYVGDSVLGWRAHMGAGSITSNVKSDRSLVTVKDGSDTIHTGLKKLGTILGDGAEIGCNTVLNPGSVVGRGSSVYPLSSVRGVVPENSIYKREGTVVPRR